MPTRLSRSTDLLTQCPSAAQWVSLLSLFFRTLPRCNGRIPGRRQVSIWLVYILSMKIIKVQYVLCLSIESESHYLFRCYSMQVGLPCQACVDNFSICFSCNHIICFILRIMFWIFLFNDDAPGIHFIIACLYVIPSGYIHAIKTKNHIVRPVSWEVLVILLPIFIVTCMIIEG